MMNLTKFAALLSVLLLASTTYAQEEGECIASVTQQLRTKWTDGSGVISSLYDGIIRNAGADSIGYVTLRSSSSFVHLWEMDAGDNNDISIPAWRHHSGIAPNAVHQFGYIITGDTPADLVVSYCAGVDKDGGSVEPTSPAGEEPNKGEPTDAPAEPTSAPEEPTSAPEEPTSAPEEPTEAPEEPTEAPEEPTDAPEEPTFAPEEPTEGAEETEAPTTKRPKTTHKPRPSKGAKPSKRPHSTAAPDTSDDDEDVTVAPHIPDETQAPETQAPETQAPETQAPETEATEKATEKATTTKRPSYTKRPSTTQAAAAPTTTKAASSQTTKAATTKAASSGGNTSPGGTICPSGTHWQPSPMTTWQWQLTGTVDTSLDVQMYDIDLFDASASLITKLHNAGKVVICYFSTQYEDWRPDAKSFTASVLGNNLDDWQGERYVDYRSTTVRNIMAARMDLAASKGCDGVEPDNVDSYSASTGFPLKAADQLDYNKFIANTAHARSLSVGLKNDLSQAKALEPYFDWILNEQCNEYSECGDLSPFTNAGKAAFNTEYEGSGASVCPKMNTAKISSLIKDLSLGASIKAQCCTYASGGCSHAAYTCVSNGSKRSAEEEEEVEEEPKQTGKTRLGTRRGAEKAQAAAAADSTKKNSAATLALSSLLAVSAFILALLF